jgi:hypothetical protein
MKTQFELAQVIEQFEHQLPLGRLTAHHRRTLSAIRRCRTAALGGHVDACDECGFLRISYNSCRNRHCPKCQGLNKETWIIQQEDQLLPTTYFHVVFTIPHELNPLCLHQPGLMYNLLFKAAWYTLDTFARDAKWLGAKTAATMVLHTWGQNLSLHPHLHCIVPNGGLTAQGQWQLPCRGNARFLYPVSAMRKVFKAFFLKQLKELIAAGALPLPKEVPAQDAAFYRWKENLYQKDWVVFTKKPFAGVLNVVKYLARYSHRVAITNGRILGIDQHNVRFDYKDYAHGAKRKEMMLSGIQFLHRFCLHFLPPRFRKIRQFGFLANACKGRDLARARKALGLKQRLLLSKAQRKSLAKERLFDQHSDRCPCCRQGHMVIIGVFAPNKDPPFVGWPYLQ